VKQHKTSGGRKMPVRHTIPLGIVIFLVVFIFLLTFTNLYIVMSVHNNITYVQLNRAWFRCSLSMGAGRGGSGGLMRFARMSNDYTFLVH